jgi:hypothetical protein
MPWCNEIMLRPLRKREERGKGSPGGRQNPMEAQMASCHEPSEISEGYPLRINTFEELKVDDSERR